MARLEYVPGLGPAQCTRSVQDVERRHRSLWAPPPKPPINEAPTKAELPQVSKTKEPLEKVVAKPVEQVVTQPVEEPEPKDESPKPQKSDEELVKQLLSAKPGRVRIEVVQEIVAAHFGTSVGQSNGVRKDHTVLLPRQVGMFLSREFSGQSLGAIGRHYGGRDHSTVYHAWQKIERLLNARLPDGTPEHKDLFDDVAVLRQRLTALRTPLLKEEVEAADENAAP